MTPEERQERRLARKVAAENERRVAAAPLLAHAGLVVLTDAEEQRQRKARHKAEAKASFEALRRTQVEHLRKASEIRARLRPLVGLREILAADAYVARVFGGDGTYAAEFWREREARLGRGEPLLPVEVTWMEEEREASRRRCRDLLAVWAAVDVAHPDLVAAALGPPSAAQRRAVRDLGELRGAAADRATER